MFEELYDKIEKKLIENDINEASVIKDYCDEMVKKTFRKMLPGFEGNLNNAEELVLECSRNLAADYDTEVSIIYERMSNELDVLVPNWRNYIDLNNLSNAISDNFVDQFYKNKYAKDENDDVKSFDEAINATINRNMEYGYTIDSADDMEGILKKILHEYFDKGNELIFTSKNKARNYVLTRTRKEILEEMMSTAGMDSDLIATDLESQIRDEYINAIISSTEF